MTTLYSPNNNSCNIPNLNNYNYSLNIFEEWINFSNWIPEIAATGGGNNEFQIYNFDKENVLLQNNTLHFNVFKDISLSDIDCIVYRFNFINI